MLRYSSFVWFYLQEEILGIYTVWCLMLKYIDIGQQCNFQWHISCRYNAEQMHSFIQTGRSFYRLADKQEDRRTLLAFRSLQLSS